MKAFVARGVSEDRPLLTLGFTASHPVPVSPPTDTALLVKVAYASVNPADIQYINGVYKRAPAHPMPTFPCPLGVDGAGVVLSVGSRVTKFKPGDQVLGLHKRMDEGTWAGVASFEESELAIKPPGICWQLAAAVPVAGMTALSALLCCPALGAAYSSSSSSCCCCCNNSPAGHASTSAAAAGPKSTACQATGMPPTREQPSSTNPLPTAAAAATPIHLLPFGTTQLPVTAEGSSCGTSTSIPPAVPQGVPIGSSATQGTLCPSTDGISTAGSSSICKGCNSSGSADHGVRSVLILGSSGGVGSFAVLLAKHFFRIPLVLATCSGRNAGYVRQLGADVVIDYSSQNVEAAVLQALPLQKPPGCSSNSSGSSGGGGGGGQLDSAPAPAAAAHTCMKVDLVVDNVGGSAHMSMAARLLTPSTGVYITSVPLSNPASSSFLSVLLFFAHLGLRKLLHRVAPGSFPAALFNGAGPDGSKLQRLVDWLASAEVVVRGSCPKRCLVRLTEYDLQDTGAALAAVYSKRAVGKLVLTLDETL